MQLNVTFHNREESSKQSAFVTISVARYAKYYCFAMPDIVLRTLCADDFHKARFHELSTNPDYQVLVAEGEYSVSDIAAQHVNNENADIGSGALVGTATLLLERKFLRHCGKVGHIEDVVVDERCRGARLGLRLITALTEAAQAAGCYKVVLDCSEDNVAFYEKCGLRRKDVQMRQLLLAHLLQANYFDIPAKTVDAAEHDNERSVGEI
ncbi:hypothetical protein QJQ45_020094 [Haematococcus lacustris]|nr:hypothetical protein QJQ45_020094 [Haematococcus lacustris]